MMKARQKGFTLIELILTAVIISILAVVLSKMMSQGYKSFRTANDINQADWQAWLAIQRIGEDIHRIQSRTSITSVQPAQFVFTDVGGTQVSYQLSGSTLLRNGNTLASNIQNLVFGYRDANGNSTSVPSAVRYVTVSITAASNDVNVSLSTMLGTRYI